MQDATVQTSYKKCFRRRVIASVNSKKVSSRGECELGPKNDVR